MWSETESRGPDALSGVRVFSFGAFVAGNTSAMILAELGADVVKIESHRRPESLRAFWSPDHDETYEPSGVRPPPCSPATPEAPGVWPSTWT